MTDTTVSSGPPGGAADRSDPRILRQLVDLTGRERGRYAALRLEQVSVAEALATVARERAAGGLEERRAADQPAHRQSAAARGTPDPVSPVLDRPDPRD